MSCESFVECVPFISDASVRAGLYGRIAPLLDGLPQALGGTRAPREAPPSDDTQAAAAFEIRRAAMRALTQIRGHEIETFHKLAQFVREGVDRAAAIHALQSIPRTSWPKEEAGPLTAVLIEQIRQTPVRRRTRPAALDAREFCDALSTLLPADAGQDRAGSAPRAGRARGQDRHRFRADVVRQGHRRRPSGKAGRIRAGEQRPDAPQLRDRRAGALEEIGLFSEAHAQQPAFAARNYVPRSPKVLLSSVLLQPRDVAKLSFIAPAVPGVYPFVCTYPGHWRRMYGALYVVDDLDAYLADPEKYVAGAKLVPRDALLKDRRPRTEWTFADLAAPIEEMSRSGGRSFGNGKQIFTVANCVACHRLEGVGNSFGPDLTKLDPKWKPADILNEILDSVGPDQREVSNERVRARLGQSRDGIGPRGDARDDQGHREPVGEGGADDHPPRRRRRAAALKDVDDAQGTSGQADARRDPRPGGLRGRGGQSGPTCLPGKPSRPPRTTTTPRPARMNRLGLNRALTSSVASIAGSSVIPNAVGRRSAELTGSSGRSVGRVGDQDDRHFLVHRVDEGLLQLRLPLGQRADAPLVAVGRIARRTGEDGIAQASRSTASG